MGENGTNHYDAAQMALACLPVAEVEPVRVVRSAVETCSRS